MANTGKTSAKALSDQEKALARYQIILQDTQLAQGDFARTSDSLANQTRKLRANLDDLAGRIGGALSPTLADLAEAANLVLENLSEISDFEIGGASVSSVFQVGVGLG